MHKLGNVKAVLLAIIAATMMLALTACGGNQASYDKFVGNWDLYEMQDGSNNYNEETLKSLEEIGFGSIYMTLSKDGTASMSLFGQALQGTWTGKDDNTIHIAIDQYVGDAFFNSDNRLEINGDNGKQRIVFKEGRDHSSDADQQETPSDNANDAASVQEQPENADTADSNAANDNTQADNQNGNDNAETGNEGNNENK